MSATSTKHNRAGKTTSNTKKPDRPHRVLLVDDDPALRKALAKRLEVHGMEIFTAGCGSDAISTFEEKQADMVVLDVNMPDIDGFEVCQKIKAIRDVPVIFVPASRTRSSTNTCHRSSRPSAVCSISASRATANCSSS